MTSSQASSIDRFPERGDLSLIAIIDNGIDIFHNAFLDISGNTRIIAIWDQTDNTGPSPTVPGITRSLGREYTSADINGYIQQKSIPINLNRNLRGREHGTHVASIAAGSNIDTFSGIAPKSEIIIIIPQTNVKPVNSHKPGLTNAYNMAFLYIQGIARQHNKPVVVNISQGRSLGARDGTSGLERSCDNFSNSIQSPGIIVISAGNQRDKQCHAAFPISKDNQTELCWESTSIIHSKDRIELWFKNCNKMKFRLVNPSQQASSWMSSGSTEIHQFTTGDSCQLSYESHHPTNQDSRLLVTITSSSSHIEKGIWKLEIKSVLVEDPKDIIHAWIQYVDGQDGQFVRFTNYISDRITLTMPATANSVISVGSVKADNVTSNFSSCGPTRDGRSQPILAAPGEYINGAFATSGDLETVHSNRLLTSGNGTSMAAPHVTGAIALLLSARERQRQLNSDLNRFNAAEIRQLIIDTVQHSDGEWYYDKGYGVLDVRALLERV